MNTKDKLYKEFLKLDKRKNEILKHQRRLKKLGKRYNELEKELQEIKTRLYSGKFNSFLTNYGKSFPRFKDRSKIKSKCKKFKKGEIDDIFNEKIPREYEY